MIKNPFKESKKISIPDGPVGDYPLSVLDSFKHAIAIKARVFARGRKRRPSAVILGQNQLKMLRQDETAQWMLEGLKIEESKEKSKFQFR